MDTNSILTSWVKYDKNNHFPVQNIPFGVCTNKQGKTFCCSRIGDFVIDLASLEEKNFLNTEAFKYDLNNPVLNKNHLNHFIALGKNVTNSVRLRIIQLFSHPFNDQSSIESYLIPISEVTMRLPVKVGDYTDFYSSMNHAFNMGCILRGPDNALQPNWKHLPVGYHGKY